jgi:hypothetical protein
MQGICQVEIEKYNTVGKMILSMWNYEFYPGNPDIIHWIYYLGCVELILWFVSPHTPNLAIQLTSMTTGNGKCIAHRFFKIFKILNTKFQHTSTIEMYCVENQVCVAVLACMPQFWKAGEPEL